MKKLLLSVIILTLSIAGLYAQQQAQNGGYEDWEDIGSGLEEPVDWSSIKTSDNETLNPIAPVVWEKSSDAHTGSFSLKLFNVSPFPGIVASGTITNGRVHSDMNPDLGYVFTDPDDEQWHTVFTERPDSIAFWIKFFPQDGDSAQIQALLHVGEGTLPATETNQENWVGYARMNIAGTYDTWTRFSVPFTYYNEDDPEYVLIILTSGNGTTPVTDSYALYDDIEFIYNPNGINNIPTSRFNIYGFDNIIYLGDLYNNFNKNSSIEIFSLNGNKIWSAAINSDRVRINNIVSKGIYIVRITSKDESFSQKLFIR